MNSYLIDLFAGPLVVTPAYFRLLYYVVHVVLYITVCNVYHVVYISVFTGTI